MAQTDDKKLDGAGLRTVWALMKGQTATSKMVSGVCSTSADVAAKKVDVETDFTLVADAVIIVTFTNSIAVANATLAIGKTVDGVGTYGAAKPIYYRGAALAADLVKAGDRIMLRYNGTQWDIIGTLDTDTDTLTDISYNAQTGKLQKTINGQTTEVCDIVQSGFVPTYNSSTGIITMTPVGGAAIAPNATTGLIEMNF